MTRFILLLILILTFPLSLCVAEPAIHVVIAADGRAGFGANMVADYKNMERLFKENVPKSRLHLIAMEPDEITPDKILQTIRQIEIADEDTLVFYYSGHAAHNAGSGGQFFQLKEGNGSAAELQRRTLLATLKEKKLRLTVLLTDCCNIEQKASDVSKEVSPAAVPPEKMSPIFESLFIKPTGTVDITSSKRGEASFVDSTEKKRGSCFTYPLVALLEKHRTNESMTWTDFVAELKTDVQKAFLDSHPGGFKFDPPLNGIIVQKTQTIEVYGTLPGTAEPLPVAHQGPRFGVRAVSHPGGGVRITEVVPNAPGRRAGFEIGDVILDINGTPIRNEQDYSKAIDDS
ncbi:MAG: caspase family protein, partial [Planctomycetaceae bacterium]|nr:caspase family protein [Planctomycetaceae bacterium]